MRWNAADRQATSSLGATLARLDPAEQQLGLDDVGSGLGNAAPRGGGAEPLAAADPDEREDAGGQHRRVLEPDR